MWFLVKFALQIFVIKHLSDLLIQNQHKCVISQHKNHGKTTQFVVFQSRRSLNLVTEVKTGEIVDSCMYQLGFCWHYDMFVVKYELRQCLYGPFVYVYLFFSIRRKPIGGSRLVDMRLRFLSLFKTVRSKSSRGHNWKKRNICSVWTSAHISVFCYNESKCVSAFNK